MKQGAKFTTPSQDIDLASPAGIAMSTEIGHTQNANHRQPIFIATSHKIGRNRYI
jgi:hypothetical protein